MSSTITYKLEIYYSDALGYQEPEIYDLRNVSISKERDQQREFVNRIKVTGQIAIIGDAYDIINNDRASEIKKLAKLYDGEISVDNLIVQGNINIRKRYNLDDRIVFCDFIVNDEYQTLIENRDKEINVIEYDQVNNLVVDVNIDDLEFSHTNFKGGSFFVFLQYDVGGANEYKQSVYARQKRTVSNVEGDILRSNGEWVLLIDNGDGTEDIARPWENSGFQEPSTFDGGFGFDGFNSSKNIILVNSVALSGIVFDELVFTYFITDGRTGLTQYFTETFIFLGIVPNFGAIFPRFVLRKEVYYDVQETEISYPRARLFKDVFQYIIEQIDNTIMFDGDSFAYLDNNFETLVIQGISDTELSERRVKSNKQNKLLVSLSDLEEALQQWGFTWVLENISSQYFFRLKHITEKNLSIPSGVNDFTTYLGQNWTLKKNIIEYKDEDKFNRLHRNYIAENIDFIGLDIIVNGLENLGLGVKEYTQSIIYTDIDGIYENPSIYPSGSTKDLFLLNCDYDPNKNLINSFTNDTDYTFPVYGWSKEDLRLTLDNNVGNIGIVKSNSIYSQVNKKITISFTSDKNAPNLYVGIGSTISASPFGGLLLLLGTVALGANTFEYTSLVPAEYYIIFYSTTETGGVGDVVMTNVLFKSENTYVVRKSTGVLSNRQVQNAELSLSNLDNQGITLVNMPYNRLNVNNVDVEVTGNRLNPDKMQQIQIPLRDVNDLDFLNYVKTDLTSEAEIQDATIKLDDSNICTVNLRFINES